MVLGGHRVGSTYACQQVEFQCMRAFSAWAAPLSVLRKELDAGLSLAGHTVSVSCWCCSPSSSSSSSCFCFFCFSFFHPFTNVKPFLGSLVLQNQAVGRILSVVCQPTSGPDVTSEATKHWKWSLFPDFLRLQETIHWCSLGPFLQVALMVRVVPELGVALDQRALFKVGGGQRTPGGILTTTTKKIKQNLYTSLYIWLYAHFMIFFREYRD